MRLGLPLHVSAEYRRDPPIRCQPRAASALPVLRSAGVPAMAGALLPGLRAGPGVSRCDGGHAADPPQPDRARGADRGSRSAPLPPPPPLAQNVSVLST